MLVAILIITVVVYLAISFRTRVIAGEQFSLKMLLDEKPPTLMTAFLVALATSALVAALSYAAQYAMFLIDRQDNTQALAPDIPADILFLGFLAFIWIGVCSLVEYTGLDIRSAKESVEANKKELDKGLASDASFRDAAVYFVRRARLREDTTLQKALIRADHMYFWGVILMGIALLGPLGGAWIYWRVEPLTDIVVERIKELNATPSTVDVSVQRDWKVLLGGVSVGFLFLAAATAVLRQKTKEVQISRNSSDKVSYYERLEYALLLEAQPKTDEEKALFRYVIDRLLADRSGLDLGRSVDASEDTHSSASIRDLLGVLRQAT
ncbi:hypothetical protein [Aeoliella sp.]|uniref:hypothetical protein n=1 Tax=Aeoliella sp. TaxID=2795800 RepID=UPI003CCBAC9D